MKRYIFCKTTFEGLHCWKDILDTEECQYLKNYHRHIFHIEVVIPVYHSDRNIEFIELKHRVNDFLTTIFPNKINNIPYMGTTSCELLAELILTHFNADKVSVSEDNENGSIVLQGFLK
jgi:hypothetical protein